jgi:hypothetical protein
MFCAFAAAAAVACSSGGGKSNGDAGPGGGVCPTPVSSNACEDGCNPCTRLSDAQVAAVVGQSVTGQWNGDVCAWDFYDAQDNPSLEVELHVNTDYGTFELLCHPPGNAADSGIVITPVPGVGDDACYISTPSVALGAFEIEFLKGCDAYAVSITGPAGQAPPFSQATAQAYEKALALDAVPNL